MKYASALLACYLILGCFVIGSYAHCDCDPTDIECVNDCVLETNDCVSSCKGEVHCYQGCIQDKWPGADTYEENSNTVYFNGVLAAPATTVYIATTTVVQSQTSTNSIEAQQQSMSSAAVISATNTPVYSSLASTVSPVSILPMFVVVCSVCLSIVNLISNKE